MKRDTRQQIVNFACEKFYKHGFYKVSMDSIVEELRISKSTLYKYFPSKEDLIIATMRKYTSTIDEKFEEIINDENRSVYERVTDVAHFYGSMLSTLSEEYLRDAEIYYPELWKKEVDYRTSRFTKFFTELYSFGLDSGSFRSEYPKEVIVFLYIKETEMVYSKFLENINLSRQEAFDIISTIFLRGLLTQRGRDLYTSERRLALAKKNDQTK